ncbi:DNA polymerase III beta subunit, sliding clamp [Achromobacter phage Motura]|uniref:DNA polymerase III beta subunit, sliding clamp n=1 Tax=Achromobacter phage Motura TaxID=2591403 RepID=A0A514CSG0_9CAUD|nr:DNA polymerase III beta subunit, sliding clamp [Achromobacter phage Motura]QDH83410.1 DNA polymerase III beta subunit, sliding clamp [Achromobacter phage Motura]
MQAKIESASIQDALKTVLRLAAPASGNITLDVQDKIYLRSFGELNQCHVKLPGTPKGKASFSIPATTLQDAVKGRKEVSLEFKNTMLNITAGSYKADLATVDAIMLEAPQSEGKPEVVKISGEQAQWLKQAVTAVSLKPNVIVSAFMPCGIKLTKKGAYVACFDSTHMAFIKSKEITGDCEFVLPLDTVQAVLDIFAHSDFTMEISTSNIRVKNKVAQVILAVPELDQGLPKLTQVISTSEEAIAAKGKSIEVPRQDLLAFLDNSRAVAIKERAEIECSAKETKVQFAMKTANGNTKVTLDCKAKAVSFKVDFEQFDEVVRKSGDAVSIRVVNGAFLLAQTPKTVMIVGLNQ